MPIYYTRYRHVSAVGTLKINTSTSKSMLTNYNTVLPRRTYRYYRGRFSEGRTKELKNNYH